MIVLPTDAELVGYAAATYDPAAVPYIDDVNNSIRSFLFTRADGLNIIAIEGTHNPLGWALDFFGVTIRDQQGMNHETLGWIHAGFYASAVASLTRAALIAASGPYAICGHSLGAGLALLIGALLSQDELGDRGLAPVKIGAFAPPRVGGDAFVKTINAIPFCAYRFGNDPVPEVPITIPDFPYRQVALTQVGAPMLDPFKCHDIQNYVAAVKALTAVPIVSPPG